MVGAGERAVAASVGDGLVDDVQGHTTPLQTQQHHQHRYKTPAPQPSFYAYNILQISR